MTNSNSNAAAAADQGGAPPLPHHRRPRVREISSRFMSPSPYPSSSSSIDHLKSPRPKHPPAPDHHRSSQRRQHEPFLSENIPQTLRRSLDHCPKPESFSTHRKQQQRSLKENENQISKSTSSSTSLRTVLKPSRSDTLTAAATCDRIVPSRFRLPHAQKTTDAAKLLQSSVGLSFSSINENSNKESESSISIQGGSCPNTPLSSQHTTTWPHSDTVTDKVKDEEEDTSLSTRLLPPCSTSTNCQTSSKFSTPSLCSRSLNFQLSIKNTPHHPPATITNSLTTEHRNSTKSGLGVDSKKGGKKQLHSSSEEDIHSLKLLYNHYLLWRYANAKANASVHAQTTQMENHFFSIGADISHLRDAVKRKQVEHAILQKIKALSTIVEAQMPYLDEWSAFEEEYTCSLSGATTALTNSLLRLPVSGNVQVKVNEAAEALDSAVKLTDIIVDQMQSFLPKAEEMGTLMSELANDVDIQRALVEECGNLLLKTHNVQVEDCSLRGHLMQLRCSNVF